MISAATPLRNAAIRSVDWYENDLEEILEYCQLKPKFACKFVQNPSIPMSSLIQIIRNLFFRLEGLLYRFFGLFSKLSNWLKQLFSSISKLLGFAPSQFLEDEQSIKPVASETDVPASVPQYSPSATSTTRRRPDSNMEYFLKLAQQKKTSS